jgi:sterol desaturase/sphingolipid hydroxylase (fatty acid hydroxylase superfamily)
MEIIYICGGIVRFETILISLYIFCLVAEWRFSVRKQCQVFEKTSTIRNITIGLISLSTDFLFSLGSLPLMHCLYTHYRWFQFDSHTLLSWLLLFLLLDFVEYWFHRLSHEINLLWLAHIVHHQSETYNLTTGLRTSFLIPIFNTAFYLIFPLLSFETAQLLLLIFVQGIYQLLIHTEFCGKWGILEKIIVTPSVHRVHHGRNAIYLDKNYGKVLLIWDRIFRTWQEETEAVDYGVVSYKDERNPLASMLFPINRVIRYATRLNGRKRRQLILGSPSKAEELIQDYKSGKQT